MNSTTLSATNKTENGIMFKSNAHEKFYYEKLKKMQNKDEYHMALCYCLGINSDTRKHIDSIYSFETGCVRPECLQASWQTSGSMKVVRMAFNLYCNGTPSVDEDTTTDEQLYECRQYSVEELFCCEYALYFWQAVQIRYPEYTSCNRKLSELTGG